MGIECKGSRSLAENYGELKRGGEMGVLEVARLSKAFGYLLHQEPGVVIYDRDFTLKTPILDNYRYPDLGYKPTTFALIRELNEAGWTSYMISNGINGEDKLQNYLHPNVFLPESGMRNWEPHYKNKQKTIAAVGKHLVGNGAYEQLLEHGLYMVGDRETDVSFFAAEISWLKANGQSAQIAATFIKLPDPFYDKFPGSTKYFG